MRPKVAGNPTPGLSARGLLQPSGAADNGPLIDFTDDHASV